MAATTPTAVPAPPRARPSRRRAVFNKVRFPLGLVCLVGVNLALDSHRVSTSAGIALGLAAFLLFRDRLLVGCTLGISLLTFIPRSRDLPVVFVAGLTAVLVIGFFASPRRLWCGVRPILLVALVGWTTIGADVVHTAATRCRYGLRVPEPGYGKGRPWPSITTLEGVMCVPVRAYRGLTR